jgi:ATP-dependent RNA helicase DeaD
MTEPLPSPPPPLTFDSIPLSADIRKAIDALGYTHPTPVQRAVFEPAVRGKNLVVQARTGTGKTAAFGLPIIDQLVRRNVDKVQALVLTPTRELALQVARELTQIAQFRGTQVTAIYGGAPMGKQIEALQGGAQIVVGTPGRVLDHLRRKTLDPSNVRIFVLDEADEMLSMGFAKELHAIAETLPKERQGLFFSATIPPDIERLAIAQLRDPEFVTLSSDQVGAQSIAHFVYVLGAGDKRKALVRIIEVEDPESALIFCNTKDETERTAEALQNSGFDAEWLNGDLEQKERERIMQKTREGKLRFLVATDVAARGIDLSHLTHVINADFPESAEAYVHRTGRTGRAGRTGTAISLVHPKDVGHLYILRLTYKIRPIEKQLPSDQELKTRGEHDLVTMFAEAFKGEAHPDDLALARRLLTHPDCDAIIAGLLRTNLGARAAEGVNPKTEAAEARRAKNPAPLPVPVMPVAIYRAQAEAVTAPPPPPRAIDGAPAREPRRPERAPRRGEKARVPHASFTNWEPPSEKDDDQPILSVVDPPLPKFEVSAVRADLVIPPIVMPRPAPPAKTNDASDAPEDEPGFAQIFVNVGRRDGAKAGDIQRLLTEAGGIARSDTGRIRVRDRNTFVSIRKEAIEKAIAALAGQVVGGRSIIAELARERVV